MTVGDAGQYRFSRQPEFGAGGRGRRTDVFLGSRGGDDASGEEQGFPPGEFIPVPESTSGNEQTVRVHTPAWMMSIVSVFLL